MHPSLKAAIFSLPPDLVFKKINAHNSECKLQSFKDSNASVKLGDSFFTTKNTNGHEKISWQTQCILADNATSMKFFRVRLCISWLKKEVPAVAQVH